jgi:hypothetical protein
MASLPLYSSALFSTATPYQKPDISLERREGESRAGLKDVSYWSPRRTAERISGRTRPSNFNKQLRGISS